MTRVCDTTRSKWFVLELKSDQDNAMKEHKEAIERVWTRLYKKFGNPLPTAIRSTAQALVDNVSYSDRFSMDAPGVIRAFLEKATHLDAKVESHLKAWADHLQSNSYVFLRTVALFLYCIGEKLCPESYCFPELASIYHWMKLEDFIQDQSERMH